MLVELIVCLDSSALAVMRKKNKQIVAKLELKRFCRTVLSSSVDTFDIRGTKHECQQSIVRTKLGK